jgi:hypothetical protein
VESHATVIIPFDDRLIFVRCSTVPNSPVGFPKFAQTLDAISGIQFLAGGRGLGEQWLPGTV